jgi:hypothetical protein
MTSRAIVAGVLLLVLSMVVQAQKKQRPPDQKPEIPWLERYNVDDPNARVLRLPKRLAEASGLATSPDGRVFCHNDEEGVVCQIDLTNGKVVKQFSIGRLTVRDDFEGIAIADTLFYLVSSGGRIYEFKEGGNGAHVGYQIYKTALSEKNDVEGLEFNRAQNVLLLACKGDAGKGLRGMKAVYAFSLKNKKLIDKPHLLLPLDSLGRKTGHGQFNPSGIAIHPVSGTYFIVSANGRSILEFSSSGTILGQQHLPSKTNRQPEGITFGPGHALIICNDGRGSVGTLTVYEPLR